MTFREEMALADVSIKLALGDTVYLVSDTGVNLDPVVGLFEDQYVDVNSVECLTPTFLCNTADIPDDTHDYMLTFSGTTYRVIRPEPSSDDMTLLILEKQ